MRLIEKRRGQVIKQRQIVFFAIFLVLVQLSFQLLKALLGTE